jgi:hypothetical protein
MAKTSAITEFISLVNKWEHELATDNADYSKKADAPKEFMRKLSPDNEFVDQPALGVSYTEYRLLTRHKKRLIAWLKPSAVNLKQKTKQ